MGNKRIGYRSGLLRGLLGFTLALSGVFLCPAMVLSDRAAIIDAGQILHGLVNPHLVSAGSLLQNLGCLSHRM